MFRFHRFLFLLAIVPLLGRSAALLAQEANAKPESGEVTETVVEESVEEPVVEEAPPRFVLPIQNHAWARYQAGAWREVRITTETFDPKGKVVNRSVTTQKEVLKAVAEETYALDVQATVDLIGKRIVGNWKTRVLKIATDDAGEVTNMQRLEDETFSSNGESFKCQVWELRYLDDSRQMRDHIVYHPERFPFVLHRETQELADGDTPLPPEQIVHAMALDLPYRLGDEIIRCSYLQILRQRPKGASTRVVFVAPSIPGGEVAAWSSDFDSKNQLTRSSIFELIDFGTSPGE